MTTTLFMQEIVIIVIMCGLFVAVALMIILPYSAYLYRKLLKTEPEFFSEKNICYYLTKINSTQFVFYILLGYFKRIKDKKIRNTCYILRNILLILLILFALVVIVGLFVNIYLSVKKS